ncbi:hypothetical protein COV13_04470 [Candidatus Woesearchaeota archaeon CG10_big_fil_rev_8_21_14_0_10_32_9]|nr:MAG: hypothetical protein COV13_04470 [Candidatus Woesearchaeota archaeon CG10_big_fil_rev_8_21_14_0_10_32_9]
MKEFLHKIAQELLLNSGQYAVFYILMNFSKDGSLYFANFGHVILLIALAIQTLFLIKFGSIPKMRFFGSLIAPFVYTLVELPEGPTALLNTAHVLFWTFSLITAGIQSGTLLTKNLKIKKIYEVTLVMINVLIFLCIYLYFDLYMLYNDEVIAGTMTSIEMKEQLEFYNLGKGMVELIKDATHIYILLAGLLMGSAIAWSRVQVIALKDKIHEAFGEYVDTKIRDKILSKNSISERKKVTILFSDIRGFTGLSEKHTPEQIISVLNTCFSAWDNYAKKNEGIIDKFIGDAVMIIFDDSKNATSCANEFLSNLSSLNNTLSKKSLPVISVGVGIHTGIAIAGTIGSTSRKNYTFIGDAVNVASRLESLCKEYNCPLIISEEVFKELSNKKQFNKLNNIILRGRKKSTSIYGLKG